MYDDKIKIYLKVKLVNIINIKCQCNKKNQTVFQFIEITLIILRTNNTNNISWGINNHCYNGLIF